MAQRIRNELEPVIDDISRVVENRIQYADQQCQELEQMRLKSGDLSNRSIAKVKKERLRVRSVVEKFQYFQKDLKDDVRSILVHLDIYALDKMIAKSRFEIGTQLTTLALMQQMDSFYAHSIKRYKRMIKYISRLDKKAYKTFETIQGMLGVEGLKPRRLDIDIYLDMLRKCTLLHQQYATGFGAAMTEQMILRNRYYSSVMLRIRELYKQTGNDVGVWYRNVLMPLELEIKERQAQLRRRMISLERIQNTDADLIRELETANHRYQKFINQKMALSDQLNRFVALSTSEKEISTDNVIRLHVKAQTR